MTSHPAVSYVVGGGVAIVTIYVTAKLIFRFKSKPKPVYPRDTVILHQMARGPYAPSVSPFVLKLETYLRMAKIPYQTDHDQPMSNKHKTPWMTYNDVEMGDSQLCIEYLNKMLGVDVNSHLSDEEKATARAFEKMVDENTYWCLVLRHLVYYMDYKYMKMANPVIPWFVVWLIQWGVKKSAYGQGMGRHTKEEVENILEGDLAALSTFLGKKAFMFGDRHSEVDCSVFGQLAQFKWHRSPTTPDVLENFPNLDAYCERMKTTFWPDWEECITHGGTKKATK